MFSSILQFLEEKSERPGFLTFVVALFFSIKLTFGMVGVEGMIVCCGLVVGMTVGAHG
jgi:hypothetical protein